MSYLKYSEFQESIDVFSIFKDVANSTSVIVHMTAQS